MTSPKRFQKWRSALNGLRRYSSVLVLLVLGFGLTATASYYALKNLENAGSALFAEAVEEVEGTIVFRMGTYSNVLVETRELFDIAGEISREDFQRYVREINLTTQYPGIQSLGFSKRIPRGELETHLKEIRAQGFPDYKVSPGHERDDYYSIILLEPFGWRNQRAFGFDMFTEPVRRDAMERARDSGLPQVSGRVRLVQETDQETQPGFLIYVPLYETNEPPDRVEDRRKLLKGYVYSPFRAHDLFESAFKGLGQDLAGIDFEIYDGLKIDKENLLYDYDSSESAEEPHYRRTLTLHLVGRPWTILVQSRPNFAKQLAWRFPAYILLAGIIGVLLSAGLLIATKRQAAESKSAAERLQAEKEITDTLSELNRTISAELELEKVVQVITDASTKLTGASFGAFFYNVIGDQGESYMLYTLSGASRDQFAGFSKPRNTAIFAPTFEGKGIVRLDDVTKDPRYGKNPPFQGMPPGHLPVRSYLAAPVVSRSGEVLGGLFFGHPDAGIFGANCEHIISGIAAQAAIAIDNARLFKKAQMEVEKRRQAEQEVRELNTELEQKVYKRTRQLETANRELEAFAYSVSHDLRAPLRGIDGFSEILSTRYGEQLDEKGRDYLHRVRSAAKRMAQLIDDLLGLSRLSRREMRRRPSTFPSSRTRLSMI